MDGTTRKVRLAEGHGAAIACAVALSMLVPGPVSADEFEDFAGAKNAYEAGEYETAVTRFEAILKGQPKNKGLVEETHKLLGVSYVFVGDTDGAEAQFIELLTADPGFSLDPLVFPIDVIDFFTSVKNRHGDRIATLARERAREEEARRREEEARREAELEKLKRNVYLERASRESSLLVAFVPFGAGQFQNEQPVKGALFLSAEILLGATALTTFILHERLRPRSEEPFSSTSDRREYARLEEGFRIANLVSVITMGAVMLAGLADALYFFERGRVEWKPVTEKDVPDHLRQKAPGVSLAPFVTHTGAGLAAAGRF